MLRKPFMAKEQQALNILNEISSLIGDLWDRVHEIEERPTAEMPGKEKDRTIRELRLEVYSRTRSAYLRAKAL